MPALDSPLLPILTFLPLLGAILVLVLPARGEGEAATPLWRLAQGIGLLTFLVSIPVWTGFDPDVAGPQLGFSVPWFHLNYVDVRMSLAVDGLSILLVMLTTLIMAVVFFSARSHVGRRDREFLFWLLLMECGMLGVFLATDFFVFYVFWEVMLIPLYFVIGIWGGARRLYASIKFFLYTMAGSVLMLLAIIWITGMPLAGADGRDVFTSDILAHAAQSNIPPEIQTWLFLAFAVAFLIKVPAFPFHTWLPDAHVEAPTSGSVVLAGVLLKMGTYGLIRFCLPIFPDATRFFAPWLMLIGVIGIVYGAWLAWAQSDMKKLVAYSSISHLGYIVLGTFALNAKGLQGSVIQMVSHGVATPALFLLVGMVYERRHTRAIADYGGVAKVMPRYAFFLVLATLASVGLPGLSGFIGEFTILLGSFMANSWLTAVAALGVVFGAVYMLSMVRRVLFGPIRNEENRGLKDLSARECLVLAPLVILFFWIGVSPTTFTSRTAKTLAQIQARVDASGQR
ncbi:MAG: NADH-quinone oxidoreductase subunit M [Planctomycetota bacterium]